MKRVLYTKKGKPVISLQGGPGRVVRGDERNRGPPKKIGRGGLFLFFREK